MDEEEADAIEEAFDHDYDVAQQFRMHIVPKAVLWFTGDAMQDALDGAGMYDGTVLSGGGVLDGGTSGGGGGGGEKGQVLGAEGSGSSSPFPPSTSGSEEPECKQS